MEPAPRETVYYAVYRVSQGHYILLQPGTVAVEWRDIAANAAIQKRDRIDRCSPLDARVRVNVAQGHGHVVSGIIRPRHTKSAAPAMGPTYG